MISPRKPVLRPKGAWAFQMNWQSISRAVVSMASSLNLGDKEASSRRYRANSSPRFASSGTLSMMEPGPRVGTLPRCCTNSSKVVLWSSATLSLVTVGIRATLSSSSIQHIEAGLTPQSPPYLHKPQPHIQGQKRHPPWPRRGQQKNTLQSPPLTTHHS